MEELISVLIIDDEPVARESLESALINQGYNLIFAHNGLEGLKRAEEINPDVVLLDVMMPGMSGFEVCQKLRQERNLAEVPIILITALDDRKSRLQGLEAGADDFISKPFDRIELRTRLRSLTRLNRYRKLLTERSKTNWIIDQAKDGYALVNKNGDILYSNKSARKYLGVLDQNQLLGKNFIEQAKINYNFEPTDAWLDWPNTKTKHYLVKPENETSASSFIEVNVFSSSSTSELSWLVSLRDVTDQTNLQNDVWKFHAAISHKLRTPLTVILGCLELLSSEIDPSNSTRDLLEMALSDTKKLSENIQDILKYITSRNAFQNGKPFSLNNIINTINDLSKGLSLQSINFFGQEQTSNLRLTISDQAFVSIIRELLENSCKFHPSKSPNIEIHISQNNGKVILELRDDGIHLPINQLSQVWLPYYQVEKQVTGQVEGMGLGLTMVATLCWKVGAQCHIFNRSDKPGTVVKLIFPIADSDYFCLNYSE